MIRCWINQPSTLQEHHKLHGQNVLMEDKGISNTVKIYFTSGEVVSMIIGRNCLCEGWKVKVDTETVRMRFCDLPTGTRFRYGGLKDTLIVVESYGNGLVAKWNGLTHKGRQEFYSFVDEEYTLESEVEVLDMCRCFECVAEQGLDQEVHKLELQYFKPSGKYYSSGEFLTTEEDMLKVFDYVKLCQTEGKLPGLTPGGGKNFTIYVNAENHPNGFPILIPPLVVEPS